MRKGYLPIGAALAVASALLVFALGATSASARKSAAKPRTETEFSVIDVTGPHHRAGNREIFRDSLYSTSDRDDLVGHLRGVGTPCPGGRCFKVRVLVHIFGEGYLKVRGKFQRGVSAQRNNRLIIIGGTGEYNGAAGKVRVNHVHGGRVSLLTFDFVQ